MKTYIKPSVEILSIGSANMIALSTNDEWGDNDRQTAPGRKDNIVDDYGYDEGNNGW